LPLRGTRFVSSTLCVIRGRGPGPGPCWAKPAGAAAREATTAATNPSLRNMGPFFLNQGFERTSREERPQPARRRGTNPRRDCPGRSSSAAKSSRGHAYPGSQENWEPLYTLSDSMNSGIDVQAQRPKGQVSVSRPRGLGRGRPSLVCRKRASGGLRASFSAPRKQSRALGVACRVAGFSLGGIRPIR
jgi:hypothetical protein